MFGIEPKYYYDCNVAKTKKPEHIFELKNFSKEDIISSCKYKEDFRYCKVIKVNKIYPEITAEKLLEMICIWNYIIPCIDDCIVPIDYLELKSVVLDTMIRYSEIRYEFDINALKCQIQQLFKRDNQ